MPTTWNTTPHQPYSHLTTAQALEVEAAEEACISYADAHYGPQWGMDNQAAADALRATLAALYNRYNVAADDRMDGLGL